MERKLEEVEKENVQLRRELRRAQAFARAAQRSLEIAPSPPRAQKKKVTKKKTGKRKKRATVRALKAADRLRADLDRKSEGE
jgi:hypothetical protein